MLIEQRIVEVRQLRENQYDWRANMLADRQEHETKKAKAQSGWGKGSKNGAPVWLKK